MTEPIAFPTTDAPDLRQWRAIVSSGEDSITVEPVDFTAPPPIHRTSRLHTFPEARWSFSTTLELAIRCGATVSDSIVSMLAEASSVPSLELRCLYGESSSSILWRGDILRLVEEPPILKIHAQGGIPGRDALVCRDASLLAGYSNFKRGTWLPQVFGTVGFNVVPLFTVGRSRLGVELTDDADTVQLAASEDWPSSGIVQVNDEVIVYTTLSEDGQTLGGLTRATAANHRRSSAVMLLPGPQLDWCLADHEATAAEIRVGNEAGAILDDEAIADDLADVTATLLRRDRLPLVINHATTSVQVDSPLIPNPWVIDEDSTCFNGPQAFTAFNPEAGAILSDGFSLLKAAYHRRPSVDHDRFDVVRGVAFAFEMSDTPYWGPGTRIRVTLVSAEGTAVYTANRDGVLQTVDITGEANLPGPKSDDLPRKLLRTNFEAVVAAGWSNAAALLDNDAATAAVPGGAMATATFGFATTRPEANLAIKAVTLRALVRNTGGSDQDATLAITIPALVSETSTTTVAHGAVSEVTLSVTLDESVSPVDLFASSAEYSFVDVAGAVELCGAWLECLYEDAEALEALQTLDAIPVTASLESRMEYNPVRIELPGWVSGEGGWSNFDPADPPTVSFELVDPPDRDLWNVYIRSARFQFDAYAATSILPTEKIWARMEGRGNREDGTANPTEALRLLLTDFAGVSSDELDTMNLAGVSAAADARGLGVARVFMESRTVADAIERLLGESQVALCDEGGGWSLAPLCGDEVISATLGAADILRSPAMRIITAPGAGIYTAREWFWLANGLADSAAALARLDLERETTTLALHPRRLGLAAGSGISVSMTEEDTPRMATVTGVVYGRGLLTAELRWRREEA